MRAVLDAFNFSCKFENVPVDWARRRRARHARTINPNSSAHSRQIPNAVRRCVYVSVVASSTPASACWSSVRGSSGSGSSSPVLTLSRVQPCRSASMLAGARDNGDGDGDGKPTMSAG